MINELLFYCTQNDPFDKIPLEEGVNQYNRQRADKNLCGFKALFRHGLRLRLSQGHILRRTLHDNRLKEGSQRIVIGIGHIQDSIKPGIPVSHHDEQADGSQARKRQRQIYFLKDSEEGGAVDKSRFFQRFWNRLEKFMIRIIL